MAVTAADKGDDDDDDDGVNGMRVMAMMLLVIGWAKCVQLYTRVCMRA